VEVVDVGDVVATLVLDVLSHLFNIDGLGRALHHDSDGFGGCRDSRAQDNKGEDTDVDKVAHGHPGEEVDQSGDTDQSQTHEKIADNGEEAGIMRLLHSYSSCVTVAVMVMSVLTVCMIVFRLMTFFIVQEGLLHFGILDLILCAFLVRMRVSMAMAVAVCLLHFFTRIIVSLTRVQNLHLDQVEDEAHDGYDQHDICLDLHWFQESVPCLHEHPAHQDPDCGDLKKRSNDLSSMPAEGQPTGLC